VKASTESRPGGAVEAGVTEGSPVVAVLFGSGLEPGVLDAVVLAGVLDDEDEDEDEEPAGVAGSSPPQANSATKPATAVAKPALTLTVEVTQPCLSPWNRSTTGVRPPLGILPRPL
jgi:hypothetical protein